MFLGVNPSQFISEKNEERRTFTHLLENLFIVDASFQVSSDGWTHRCLSLCTVLFICFQELLQNCNDGQGWSFRFSFSFLFSWHCLIVLESTWILKTVTCPESQHQDIFLKSRLHSKNWQILLHTLL